MGPRGGLARRRGRGVAALWRAQKWGRAAAGWDLGCGAACWGAGGLQLLQRLEKPAGLNRGSLGVPHLSGPSSPSSPPPSGTSASEAPTPSRLHPSERTGSWPQSSSGSVVPCSQPPALPRSAASSPASASISAPGLAPLQSSCHAGPPLPAPSSAGSSRPQLCWARRREPGGARATQTS